MSRLVALLALASLAAVALPRRRCVATHVEHDLAVHVLPDGTPIHLSPTLPTARDTIH